MRLPSLGDVVETARHNLRRFPFVLVSGVVAAYASIEVIDSGSNENAGLVRLISVASLGLPLFFGLTVLGERRLRDAASRWMLLGGGALLLFGIWYAWPTWTSAHQSVRYVQLSGAFHLFVAVGPFVGFREPRAFWQYNRILFIRFLTAGLFTVVLWLGLSGALLALDKLFGVDVAGEGYGRLWIILAFVFNPWFFVAGVPDDVGALESRDDYPNGLRVFTQYVLVPIVALYLLILTLYLGKVIVTRVWPNGWIGYLVSSVAIAGIFSWLLVHPLEERPEHAWVKPFTRGFYIAIIPSIGMLWFAIWKRVEQYGITERRYFLVVLSIWLACVAVYYAFSRSRNIRLIPISLCLICLATVAGPWGAFRVSQASQRGRLAATLTRNGLLVDGSLVPSSKDVPDADLREISAGLLYLLETHGDAAVRPWIHGDMEKSIGAIGGGNYMRADDGAAAIMRALKLRYVPRGGIATASTDFFSYYSDRRGRATPLAGYTHHVHLTQNLLRDSVAVTGDTYLRVRTEPPALVLSRGGKSLVELSLREMSDSAAVRQVRGPAPGGGPPLRPPLVDEAHQGDAAIRASIVSLSGTRRPRPQVNAIEGDVFLRVP